MKTSYQPIVLLGFFVSFRPFAISVLTIAVTIAIRGFLGPPAVQDSTKTYPFLMLGAPPCLRKRIGKRLSAFRVHSPVVKKQQVPSGGESRDNKKDARGVWRKSQGPRNESPGDGLVTEVTVPYALTVTLTRIEQAVFHSLSGESI